jgi:hypothetical protein
MRFDYAKAHCSNQAGRAARPGPLVCPILRGFVDNLLQCNLRKLRAAIRSPRVVPDWRGEPARGVRANGRGCALWLYP